MADKSRSASTLDKSGCAGNRPAAPQGDYAGAASGASPAAFLVHAHASPGLPFVYILCPLLPPPPPPPAPQRYTHIPYRTYRYHILPRAPRAHCPRHPSLIDNHPQSPGALRPRRHPPSQCRPQSPATSWPLSQTWTRRTRSTMTRARLRRLIATTNMQPPRLPHWLPIPRLRIGRTTIRNDPPTPPDTCPHDCAASAIMSLSGPRALSHRARGRYVPSSPGSKRRPFAS